MLTFIHCYFSTHESARCVAELGDLGVMYLQTAHEKRERQCRLDAPSIVKIPNYR